MSHYLRRGGIGARETARETSSRRRGRTAPACQPGETTAQFWIIGGGQLQQLEQAGPGVVAQAIKASDLYVTEPPTDTSPLGQTVAYFSSYAVFAKALAAGSITRTAHWVMYDNEAWSKTPVNEQRDPQRYESLFASLAHRHGYKVILAPAQDLVPGYSHAAYHAGDAIWQRYLSLHIAAFTAKAANPHVAVFAGLSANRVTAVAELRQDFLSTDTLAAGFWLNLPKRTGTSYPAMAVRFLHELPASGPASKNRSSTHPTGCPAATSR